METTNTPNRYAQVCRVDSRGKILDFTDPNRFSGLYNRDNEGEFAPKFEINFTRYNTDTNKSEAKHKHYIDLDVLRILAWDLLHRAKGDKVEQGGKVFYQPILDDFKGSLVDKVSFTEFGEKKMVSRHLSVKYNDGLKIGPVYEFRFVVCDGEKGDKGQVKPIKGGKEYLNEFIYIPVDTMRQKALRILHHLQAKDVYGLLNG